MKRIAILTHPLTDNYGGILQAASLYHYLRRQGHQVTLIRKHRPHGHLSASTRVGRFLLENAPFQNHKGYRQRAKQRRLNESFIARHIPGATRIVYTNEEVSTLVREHGFDTVIVGSDQVWRMKYAQYDEYNTYFLDFPKPDGMRKVAYAASFGTDEWEAPGTASIVRKLLQDFDSISVREISGIEICRNTFGIDECSLAVDPTFLVGSQFFSDMATPTTTVRPGTLLTYILDSSKRSADVIRDTQACLPSGMRVQTIPDANRACSIEEWLSAFKSADHVVTDSYHGTIFSIIFRKPFVAISNVNRGIARLHSLLSVTGLLSRFVDGSHRVEDAINAPIDYDEVWAHLERIRSSSEQFLEQAI